MVSQKGGKDKDTEYRHSICQEAGAAGEADGGGGVHAER